MKKTLLLTPLLFITLCCSIFSAQAGGPAAVINSFSPNSPFCPGTTTTITYTTYGTYNPGNVFTAYLSDENGNFANQVSIGTITANTSGTMPVTIPLDAVNGTLYRIRMVSTSPVAISPWSNSFTINATITTSISISATPLQAAYGTEQVLSVDYTANAGSSATYTWYKNGNNTGITGTSYTTSTSADGDQWYCVMTPDEACRMPSTSRTVVMEIVTATIVEGDVSICPGESVTLTADEVNFPLGVRGPEGNDYGGYIIYDKGYSSDGWRYLQAASYPQSSWGGEQWGCEGTGIAGTDILLGTGDANTQLILDGCATRPIAASLCADYGDGTSYDDWYLPAKNELSLLLSARPFIPNILNYNPNTLSSDFEYGYWSSSEGVMMDLQGFDYTVPKDNMYMVYAIRKFNGEPNPYSWSTGSTANTITVTPDQTTTYTLSVTRNGITATQSITVTVNDTVYGSEAITICNGESYQLPNGNTVSTEGDFISHIQSLLTGCDSTVTTSLTILPENTFTQSPVLCAGESITVGGNTYSSTGSHTDVLTSLISGCDSTVTTNLTVLSANTFSQTLTICQGQSVTVGSNTYTTTNIYTDVLTSLVDGCDSTVTTDLTVDVCIGINNPELSGISIYPNPNNGVFTITNNNTANYVMELHNSLGQLILSQQATQLKTMLDLHNQPAGVYFISIYDGDKKVVDKVVKQ